MGRKGEYVTEERRKTQRLYYENRKEKDIRVPAKIADWRCMICVQGTRVIRIMG